jgi:hypothetical protein
MIFCCCFAISSASNLRAEIRGSRPLHTLGEGMADESSVKAELATMRKRFQLCQEAETTSRVASLDDLKHLSGDQWSATDCRAGS